MHGLLGTLTLIGALVRVDHPTATRAERCVEASRLRWEPAVPTIGTLFRVRTQSARNAADIATATIVVAGEPLHFRTVGSEAVALAAVPIDSVDGISLSVRCGDSTSVRRIPVHRGAYRLEHLRVAPQFSAPPDSALADRLRREAEQAAAVSRLSHGTPPLWTAPFTPPRSSRVTSPFGGGRTFNDSVTSRHMGTDYAGATGASVRAANRGIVRLVDRFYLGGNVVYLDHGAGLVTAYLHLSQQLVAVGDTVQRGAIVGRVGATGRVTASHLHLIARYGQITVDAKSLYALR